MKLYRRGDSQSWWMAYTIDGRTFRESTGCDKKRAAAKVMEERVEEAKKGLYTVRHDARKVTFDEWADDFLAKYSQPPFRSAKTHAYHANGIKHLKQYFSGRRMVDIMPEQVEDYRMKRLAESSARGSNRKPPAEGETVQAKPAPPVKPATVNREIEVLRRMFNIAKRKLKLLVNPCDGVERLNERRHRRRPHFMPWSEQQKICLVAHDMLRAAVIIVTETGLRIYRELTSLPKDAVDLERRVVMIDGSKTENGIREIPLTDLAFQELARLKAHAPESPWLFPSPLKPQQHLTTFKTAWRATLRRAGVPYFAIYDLRSTFATRASAGGVSESFVMDLLGHKDASAMKRYSWARVEQMREALGMLNRQAGEKGRELVQ